jgi:2-polyprenyl-6-methoxyphenol hydroxylase-like FAD-dependent oxidoreductase
VRREAFGPEEDFVVFKQHYFAFANLDLPFGAPGWTTFYNEPGRSASVFRGAPGAGQINFIFRSETPLTYDFRDIATQRRLLRDAYENAGWHVEAMVRAMEQSQDFYFDALAQVHMRTWSNKRVVLVGDAAYCASPASGAGAMLALTGAYRLAGELAKSGISTKALTAFEAAQRPLSNQKQKALFTGLTVPRSRIGIAIRDKLVASPLLPLMSKFVRVEKPSPLTEYGIFPREEALR